LLLDARPAIAIFLAQSSEFGGCIADADAESQPPAAEHIYLGGLFRYERSLALRQHDDTRRQFDSPRQSGQVAEENEWLVNRAVRRDRADNALHRRRAEAENVLIGEDVMVTQALDSLCPVTDRHWIVADLGLREDCTDAHRCLRLHWSPRLSSVVHAN
jgi:hypothetical protein